jgi:hypothetical protein
MTSNEPFLLRPENRSFLTGETRRLPGSPVAVLALLPVLGAVTALAFFWGAWYQAGQTRSFRQHALTTPGVVIDRRESSSVSSVDFENGMVDTQDDYLVKYRFEAVTPGGPRTVQREASLPKREYGKWRPAMQVAVTYDSTNPSFSVMEGEGPPPAGGALAAAGGIALGMTVFAGLILLGVWRRTHLLSRAGVKLEGRVVRCTSKKHEDGGVTLEVAYRFVSPSGREITGTTTTSRSDGAELALPAPETSLVVLYHSDSVYQVL